MVTISVLLGLCVENPPIVSSQQINKSDIRLQGKHCSEMIPLTRWANLQKEVKLEEKLTR